MEHLDGQCLRFAAAATESQVDLAAMSIAPQGKACWTFEVVGKGGGLLRIRRDGKVDTNGHKGGPLTQFVLYSVPSNMNSNGPTAVKSRKTGLFLDLDQSTGDFKTSPMAVPLGIVLGPPATIASRAEEALAAAEVEERRLLAVAESSSKACLWQCFCANKPVVGGSDGSLSLSTTKAFWFSLAGALYTSIGSNVFWCGAWTMLDIDLWPGSVYRDAIYTVVGLLLCLLTNTLAVRYYATPRKLLAGELAKRALAASARRRAEDLESMAKDAEAGSPVWLAAAKAREIANRKENEVKQATVWWSRSMGLLHGDPAADKKAVRTFEAFFEPCRTLVALAGSVLMWVGACNLLCIPEGWLQGLIPEDWWRSQSAFDVLISLLCLYVMNLSSTLGQRTGSEPSLVMEKCELYAWVTVLADTMSALMLWICMCDLLGTQLVTSDEQGWADETDTVWAQLFYITLGFLCQISTELVAAEAQEGTNDPWNLPSTYDVVSMIGGVFMNNAVWTLADTNLVYEWEYCSTDGSGGGEDGWPTCAVRNRWFTVIGLAILLMQRQVMAEAGIYSSPLMTLAVKSVRRENRKKLRKALADEERSSLEVQGSVRLDVAVMAQQGFHLPQDRKDFEASFAEALADCLNVPLERLRLSGLPQEPLVLQIAVSPPELGTYRLINQFSRFKVGRQAEMRHLAMQMTSIFAAADSGQCGMEILKAVQRGATFSVPERSGKGGKGKGKGKGKGGTPAKGHGKGKHSPKGLGEPLLPAQV